MTFEFSEEEYAPLAGLPIDTIVDLAAELDMIPPAQIDRRSLLTECVLALVHHAETNGLPFSKYDADDLADLSTDDLATIGRLQGLGERATVAAIMRRGHKVYKTYASKRNDHPIPLMLPMLLSAVARAARTR